MRLPSPGSALFGLLLSSLPLPGLAQERHACSEDSRKLCAKAETPSNRFHCLEQNAAVLSAPCREALARMRAAGDEFKRDCHADSAKLCPRLEGHDLLECLEKDPARLSAGCGRRVESIRAARRVTRERISAACKDDVGKLCAGVLPGEGRIRRCLQGNDGGLSDGCRQALAEPHDSDAVPAPAR